MTSSFKLKSYAIAIVVAALPVIARAQTDEIQVYDAAIAERGVFNLMWHNNFTPDGLKTPAFPGALVNNRNLNGVTEWAYGVTDWFELGLYLPLYSLSERRGPTVNGGKIRLLFVVPHADDRKFFYGLNFEFSYNSKHWDSRTYTNEMRPIIGWHFHPIDVIFNPILDNNWTGGVKGLDFAPATRVAYNFKNKYAVAVEEYADLGLLRDIQPGPEQVHQIWGVFDHTFKTWSIETGVGFGVTHVSDKVTLKMMWSRDLNAKKDR
jgi:hypothetical protein